MVTDQQVRLLMKAIEEQAPLATAAAQAGMSERTARKWRDREQLPSASRKTHDWRTRADPLAALQGEWEKLLELDPGLQAKALFEELQRRHAGQLQAGQLRTLQRRVRQWRASQGPGQEVYFEQEREPGVQCQSDFTDMRSLEITIGGEPYRHLLYRCVLPYSNWEHVTLAGSETFEALVGGLQESLWELGGVPREQRHRQPVGGDARVAPLGRASVQPGLRRVPGALRLERESQLSGQRARERGCGSGARPFQARLGAAPAAGGDARFPLAGQLPAGCWASWWRSATAGAGSAWRRSGRPCGRCRRGACRCIANSGAR